MKNKDWLTPEELARITGYSRQTVNKWIKNHDWTTKPKPGVQGGKARIIYVDERVRNFIKTTCHVTESPASYTINQNSLPALLLNSVHQMTQEEQDKLAALLVREGIEGLLKRLDDSES